MVVETIKKIIILGSDGFLATKLNNILKTKYKIYPFTKKQLDITKNLKKIKKIKPDIIIHPAGITNVDKCELNKKLAKKVNIKATESITTACKRLNIKLIYFSTDFIFNGKKGDYKETDKPDPINCYAYTKLRAENIVKTLKNHLILRTAILYGYNGNNSERSFTNWLYTSLKNNKNIKVVNDQIGTPTLIDDIANAIPKLIEKTGIFHLAGPQKLTRYQMAIKLAEEFNLNKQLIIPISSDQLALPAKRPLNTSLSTKKIKDLNIKMNSFSKGLKIMKSQI